MNRFTGRIISASLLFASLMPAVVFAQAQPQSFSPQLISVQVLKALLKAVSAAPAFTTARRVKAPSDMDFARAAEMLARDVGDALRSANVVETLRAEKDGVLGAARTVSSPEFVAEELTRQFAPRLVPVKRASALDGVIAVANAGDIPTDAEIKEAEAAVSDALSKVYDARVAAGKAKGSDADAAKAELAKAREALDKAKAKVGELKLKQGIAVSVSNCTFNANARYSTVQSYAVQPMVNMLLLRVGELIGNPYLPELGRFVRNFNRGRNGVLSEAELAEANRLEVGIAEGLEAQFLFKLVQELEAAGRGGDVESAAPAIRDAFDAAIATKNPYDIIWKILGPRAKREFEKKGILNDGGLVDALDYFLKLQRQLLKDDVTPLKALIDGADADIKAETRKLEVVLRKTEEMSNEGLKHGEPKVKLGNIEADSEKMEASIKALLAGYLDCGLEMEENRLNNLLYFLKGQIYSKIHDAIRNAIWIIVQSGFDDKGRVATTGYQKNSYNAFADAISRNAFRDSAICAFQRASDAATSAAYPGLLDLDGYTKPINQRLTTRLGLLLLRNLQDYGTTLDKTLMQGFEQMTVAFDNFSSCGGPDSVPASWALIENSPKLKQLQKLLSAIDEFVRRFKEIVAGSELKAGYCEIKTRIDEKERQKEEAMEKIERRAEEAKKQVGQVAPEDDCDGLGFKTGGWQLALPSCPSEPVQCPAGYPFPSCSETVAYQEGGCIPNLNNPGPEGFYVVQKVVTSPDSREPYYSTEFHNVYACATTNRSCAPPPTFDCSTTFPAPRIY